MWSALCLLLCLLTLVSSLDSHDLVYIVLSQPNIFHARKAENFRNHFKEQFKPDSQKPVLLLLHEQWRGVQGAWTVIPILPEILRKYPDKQGVLICEEDTRVDVDKLMSNMRTYDLTQKLFLGRTLYDHEPSIIHHFAFYDEGVKTFPFPDFSAGFILSMPLLQSLSNRLAVGRQGMGKDFSIDAKHELAMFIWDQGRGMKMSAAPFFCSGEDDFYSSVCATSHPVLEANCERIHEDQLFVAVKTCEKFHEDRVPVVKETWGAEAKHIEYYSETEDSSIPTTVLGVPNTERGHCGKLHAILTRANSHPDISNKDWILIADDDTIISIARLRKLLGCYKSIDPVVIGERYGFGLSRPSGYNYLTGGSGMVLSHMAVRLLMDHGMACPTDESPDDMTMGMWLKQLDILITHSPLFHQATPAGYSQTLLKNQISISFHKHWNVDPYVVYEKYLGGIRHNSTDEVTKNAETSHEAEIPPARDEL
ncbi:hypothetical protein CAPTEDRAFT_221389 [Capitella teleta]|uniref:N-acetylgalactosaminide beta-1,3-galactosyltransferase n=1 Tax=Capitella teleta TaxID=283909 RepID=R7UUN8_CAPTE|nr:hypothetical protein CAPTEDRAFT_221389 [Capitella teleta]|eukprot:ELU10358.1 hypothetical protein CAPTEDRAFT_221389 [Capitella teleta]